MTWQELSEHDIVVYSTVWCPDCRRLKKKLDEHGISYEEVDIDADAEAAERLQEATGRQAIPFVQIDSGGMVRGWHEGAPGRWDEETFLQEAEDALP